MKMYVGNLSHATTDEELRVAFAAFGSVTSATIILDQFSQKSRGFGFVEMPQMTEALAAIQALNGQELQGRQLTVNEARPRADRGSDRGGDRSGGRDRRSGGGYGGNGGGNRRDNRRSW